MVRVRTVPSLPAFKKSEENLQVTMYFRLLFLMKMRFTWLVCLLLFSCQAISLLFPSRYVGSKKESQVSSELEERSSHCQPRDKAQGAGAQSGSFAS